MNSCNIRQLSHHYFLYNKTVSEKVVSKSFTIKDKDSIIIFNETNFDSYKKCNDCPNQDSCLNSIINEYTERYLFNLKNKIGYTLLVKYKQIEDSASYSTNNRIAIRNVKVDTEWKKTISFIKNDTVYTLLEQYNYPYQKIVYTGTDTMYVINKKKYICGKFISFLNEHETYLNIEKKSGIVFCEYSFKNIYFDDGNQNSKPKNILIDSIINLPHKIQCVKKEIVDIVPF